jgi:hypothetical protein
LSAVEKDEKGAISVRNYALGDHNPDFSKQPPPPLVIQPKPTGEHEFPEEEKKELEEEDEVDLLESYLKSK